MKMKLISLLESDGIDDFYKKLQEIEAKFKSGYYYHGSPDISYLKSVSDIKPKPTTVESAYLYISPYAKTALSYAADNNYFWKGKNPGIAVFKLKTSAKKYKYTSEDIESSNNWTSFNAKLDNLKEQGYDIVTGTQKKQEVIILNPENALILKQIINLT